MKKTKVLIVDDDKNLLDLIHMKLEASGYDVKAVDHEKHAKELIVQELFDVAVIDLQLVRQDGIELMEQLHGVQPDMQVIILTAHGSIESAVEAMERGALNYLTKPFDSRELILQIDRGMEKRQLTGEITRLKELLDEKSHHTNIIARSEPMQLVLDQIARISRTDSNVAIYGASGTGKELVAKAIHHSSQRKEFPFLAINCAAIPESLLESELFGYEKGAFTGAVKTSKGLFSRADQGTIFLDEIGDMYLSIQAKLLRVLQERTFMPLGSEKSVSVDVRVIVATNKDLKEEVRKGNFREDLFYRIHVIPVELPLLKDRKEDIPLLVNHFIKKFSKLMDKKVQSVTPAAMHKMMMHDWPGNVRELENTIEYAIAMASSKILSEELFLQTNDGRKELLTLQEARARFEENYLQNLLKITGGNVTKAAELSGKYRADLYNLMKKHNISPHDFKS
ncbi:MAG: sigma-54 dependent transcriptional regulator [Desulforhopalus sp.]